MESDINHLIIVCCHAIWLGGPTNGNDEKEWAIEPFQVGETCTFLAHIKAGLDIFNAQPGGMLVFSGGPTKRDLTPMSEAESYHAIARIIQPSISLTGRVFVEDLSTDSFQNVLLSLVLFLTYVSRPPSRITVISHAFKRDRFLKQHFPALRWPAAQLFYLGLDPEKDEQGIREFESGEEKARSQWKADWWGWGTVLGAKRLRRGWNDDFVNAHGWMWRLVVWKGGESGTEPFPEPLPWEALGA